MIRLWLIGCLSLAVIGQAWGQATTCKWLLVGPDPIQVDTLPIVPRTFSVLWVPPTEYSYLPATGEVFLANLMTELDSVQVCYCTVLQYVSQPQFQYDISLIDRNQLFVDASDGSNGPDLRSAVFSGAKGLQPKGFLSRSIAAGNNQNTFFNGRFQLSVEGALTDEVDLVAELRDNQVPFQPEGNTQQIRDFDKIYVGIRHEKGWSLGVGDVTFVHQQGRFLRFQKQAMGLSGAYINPDTAWNIMVGVGQSRGRFTSQWLAIEEGVVGPYRLVGDRGSINVQILAGSERVFLNEQLLTRGVDQEYIIDYNTAEITFTPKVRISKASRVRVEYEFTDRSYPRGVGSLAMQRKVGNWEFWGQVYRHQDDLWRPYSFRLTQDLQGLLSSLPASIGFTQLPSADSVGFAEVGLRYLKKDSVINGEVIEVFEYSTNPDSALWQVSFSASENGNYVLQEVLPQGRVFRFIAPVGGQTQGTHAPIVEAPLPQLQQMVSTGMRWSAGHHSVDVEVALSQHKANRYALSSPQQGLAGWINYSFSNWQWGSYKWGSQLKTEIRGNAFQKVERYRSVEFDRVWGVDTGSSAPVDLWVNWRTEGKDKKGNYVFVEQGGRSFGASLQGWEQRYGLSQGLGGWIVSGEYYALHGRKGGFSNQWQRQRWELKYRGMAWVPGYRFEEEKHSSRIVGGDSIRSSVQFWQQHSGFIQQGDSSRSLWELGYQWRKDWVPKEGSFVEDQLSQGAWVRWKPAWEDRPYGFEGVLNFRQSTRWDGEKAQQRFWNGTATGYYKPWEGGRLRASVSTTSSRELRREFIYLQVPLGQGTHTWRDQNGNGEQELFEFVEAIYFNDRQFARFYVPTAEYIAAQAYIANGKLDLAAPKLWRTASWWKRIVAKLSLTGAVDYLVKQTVGDNLVLSERFLGQSTFYLNRGEPEWGGELGWVSTKSKQLLTQGNEVNLSATYFGVGYWQPMRKLSIYLRGEQKSYSHIADFWEGQTWGIQHWRWVPEVRWQSSRGFRLAGSYRWQKGNSQEEPIQGSNIQEFQLQLQRQGQNGNRNIQGQVSYVDISLTNPSQISGPLAFQLLEGLRPGANWITRLEWQERFENGLQLNVFYEGRFQSEAAAIHSGNAQLSWSF